MEPLSATSVGLATMIGGYSGAISAITAISGVWFQLRKVNTLKVLRDGIIEIKDLENHDLEKKSEEELLLEWMNHASLIIRPFKQKLFIRFLTTLVIIAMLSAGISLDMPGYLYHEIKGIEFYDLLLIPAVIFVGLINNTSLLLKAEEKEFLAGLTSLQNVFYEWYVIPAMVEFNVGTKKLESLPMFKRAIAREHRESERIENVVTEYLRNIQVKK